MNKEPIAYIIERECCGCGKPFEVRVDWESNKIITECFYGGVIRLGLASSVSRMVDNPDGSFKFVRITPLWEVLWYKIVNIKRILLHQYTDAEYWECTECCKPKCEICEETSVLSNCEGCNKLLCHREWYSNNPNLCRDCFFKKLYWNIKEVKQ